MFVDRTAAGADGSVVDFTRLEAGVTQYRDAYATATPWPHVVIDDFLVPAIAQRAAAGFPALGAERAFLARWLEARSYDGDIERAGEPFGAIVEALCGTRFCGFLEQLTGIAGLEPDRRHVGAGLHQGINGSYLRVHADHNTHPHDPARYRRVNILIYLNDTWDERWNGDLELWDSGATSCRARIAPIQNRCVVLGVDDAAFHGYGPLCLPPGGSRRALAFYYYADRPAPRQAERPHATILPRLNGESALANLNHKLRRGALWRIERLLARRERRP